MTCVIKIGGNDLDRPEFVRELAATVKQLSSPAVLVHGGGKEITQLQERLGLQANYVDGLRVTDEESLAIVQMVLAGRVNKRLVSALSAAGVDAFGMSGIDRTAVKAEKLEHPNGDLGWVGRVESVRSEVFTQLLDAGVTPVLSPICWGSTGDVFNVNADHVAAAVAQALSADLLLFVSNVPGLLADGKLVATLTPADAESLIEDGVIVGGMIPKVRSAMLALSNGVKAVRITDLAGLAQGTGTTVVPDSVTALE